MKRLCVVLMIFGFLTVARNAVAQEQTLRLTVENMTCSLCPVTVRKALQAVEGVQKAEVSFYTSSAVVTFDDEKTDVHTLIAATTNAGFPSTIAQEDRIDEY